MVARKLKIGFWPVKLLLVIEAIGLFTLGNAAPNNLSAGPTPADTCRYFPETGYQACGRFLDYWLNHGGLAQQGFPISQVFDELNPAPPAGDGKVHSVQYFQRARFELHEENSPPFDVLLGLLGSEQFIAKYGPNPVPTITAQSSPNLRFTEINGAAPGSYASATVQSTSGASCSLRYLMPNGKNSLAGGLGLKIADQAGKVNWTWLIAPETFPGQGILYVTCNNETISAPIQIG